MNMADPMARLLSRVTLGTASELEVDGNGCFPISQELREFAGLDDEAVLVGQGLYFELWSPALWETQKLRLQDAEANAGRFAALDLTVAR
jgi:MraZ protein